MLKNKTLETNTAATIEFLGHMFTDQRVHLVSISPKGYLNSSTFQSPNDDALYSWLEERQGEDNIYFHVNQLSSATQNKKATKVDVSRALFIHVDIDHMAGEQRLRDFPLLPTVIIFSGGGFHGYWKLKVPQDDLARVESINMALARDVGGDNCHNIDRIMRLPGTINISNNKKAAVGRKPALTYVVESDWLRVYSLDDFSKVIGPDPASSKGMITQNAVVDLVDLAVLPKTVPLLTLTVIKEGDDPDRPRGSLNAHFPSRSEAEFYVSCALARAGCSEETIAGILINPVFEISNSILEKKNPTRYALRQAKKAHAAVTNGWPDAGPSGSPKPTLRNTLIAFRRLELSFSNDIFRHRKIVNGSELGEQAGEISDDACTMLRAIIMENFGFDPRTDNVRDAVNQLCLEHSFHPIRQYLDAIVWDGVPRIDCWLISYMGAFDTTLNQAIGRIMLLAAVRRVRVPGTKFDTIAIFEGRQGSGKSTALRILAGSNNHSDNEILTLDTKSQMEAMEGVWIYELSEMSGLNRSEVERMKAFASRDVDRARMAYGRFSEARARQAIFVGTTNESQYLKDRTGNRRFLPVKTGTIDLEALQRDRDQLWAEAAFYEASGESIDLPAELWELAAVEQEERLEDDPWLDNLAAVCGCAYGDEVRVFTNDLLASTLGIPSERQNGGHTKRLAAIMRSLGWEPAKFKISGKTVRGFRKSKSEDHIDDKPRSF